MADKIYHVTSFKQKGKKFEIVIKDEQNKEQQFIVSDNLVVDFRLVKDKVITQNDFKSFLNAYNQDKNYQKVLYFATYRQRSEKEVRDYLERKQILSSDQKYYIDKLKKVSILNDDSYAKNYVFEAVNYKLLGPRRIFQDLKLKGIKKEMCEKYISEVKHEEIIRNIETLFFKKVKDCKNCSIKKAVVTLKRFIVNKGYDFSDVDIVINNHFGAISQNVNETESLEKDYQNVLKQYERKQPKQEKRQYIITKLLTKGYEYSEIKKVFERK